MRHFLLSFIMFFVFVSCSRSGDEVPNVKPANLLELKGADVSFLPELRESGINLQNSNNQNQDVLGILKSSGVNTVRLRLWHTPETPTSSLGTVKSISQEARALGLKIFITVHYSDTWADPGAQKKPTAWENLTFSELKNELYQYTKAVMQEINPDYIQIGNEINSGFLFPEGYSSNASQFTELLKEGVRAVRETNPETGIALHYAGFEGANPFFTSLSNIDYDIIGISYYPIWHGKNLNELEESLNLLSNTQNKKILIAETAYPFTLEWNDSTNNIIGLNSQISPEFSASPAGQRDFVNKIKNIISETPKGMGFCYRGGEWVSYEGKSATDGSYWENQAFWDFQNKPLPVLETFRN